MPYLTSLGVGWLSYAFQRVSLAGVQTRVLFLTAVSAGNVLVGACFYRFASGHSWSTCIFKVFCVLFRAPGVGITNEASFASGLVLTTIFIFGLFVFASYLSIVSDEVKQQLHAIRAGEVRLPLQGHVVVLNFNQQALSLLKQLSHAQADRRSRLCKRPIVVLAEDSKGSLDAAVAAVFKGSSQLRLFCRSGRPAKARDLERVAAEAADTVIVLHPDSCSSRAAADALKATALVSLTCLRERASRRPAAAGATAGGSGAVLASAALHAAMAALAAACPWLAAAASTRLAARSRGSSSMRIVVQMQAGSPSCDPVPEGDGVIGFLQDASATSQFSSSIQQVQLLSQSTLDRLVCQTAVEPGAATVFRELVRAGGDARLDWCEVGERLAGSYGSAAAMLQDSVLLGVLAADSQQLTLNPPDQLLLQPEDRLVALTRQGMSATLSSAASTRRQRQVSRTVSRVSSMASPQLGLLTTRRSSGDDGGSCSSPVKGGKESSVSAPAAAQQDAGRGRRVIVLGWPEAAVPDLLQQLQEAVPLGSCITIVLPAEQQGPATGSSTQQHTQPSGAQQSLRYMRVADPSSVQALREAGVAQADAVILGAALSPIVSPASTEADALVTAAMLSIQQTLQASAGEQQAADRDAAAAAQGRRRQRLHVVAVVSSYSIRRALQTFLSSVLLSLRFTYEITVLDEFAAGMLVSVALDVCNMLVIEQLLLLQSRSSVLRMLSLQQLGLLGDGAAEGSLQQVAFQEVRQACRRCRCTALGYHRRDGRMVLVPSPASSTLLTAADRVVVLDGSRKKLG